MMHLLRSMGQRGVKFGVKRLPETSKLLINIVNQGVDLFMAASLTANF